MDEINHFSKWFGWTSEEINLVLFLKLTGDLTKKMSNFEIFNDWTTNCKIVYSMFDQNGSGDKINEMNPKISTFSRPIFDDSKKCHFCGHLGHIIKNCKILQKIKQKKKLLKVCNPGNTEVNTVGHNSDVSIKPP